MKRSIIALILMMTLATLVAQTTTPRSWYFLLQDAAGNHLPEDFEGLALTATLNGVSRDAKTPGFGFSYSNGYMMARTQLGNFGEEWEIGDILNVVVTREGEPGSGALISLPIPEGSGPIWWGVPEYEGKTFPGKPIRLYPFELTLRCDDAQKQLVYQDGEESTLLLNKGIRPNDPRSLVGKYSLDNAPKGWRWEPLEVKLEDFVLRGEKAENGGEGMYYGLELEFRLVMEEEGSR
ncbi:MAG: hypothetical protein RBS31_01355 [Candidatus Syntrophosphaera sp.]|jgi:hypothetical protein|nr:hypothetical protein [Candidatus Cloacimonadota bacterium]MDX9949108.1 hypothetical protein [Candidatus Syntrophosphaera sp.]